VSSLRERLDALSANHPSSPGFVADGSGVDAPAETDHRSGRKAGGRGPDQGAERCGDRSVDQNARVFQPAELAIAKVLAMRGAVVAALAEDHSLRQRQPDALMAGSLSSRASAPAPPMRRSRVSCAGVGFRARLVPAETLTSRVIGGRMGAAGRMHVFDIGQGSGSVEVRTDHDFSPGPSEGPEVLGRLCVLARFTDVSR